MPISIVICAKNELHNLKEHLQSWLNQEYPDFELLIVNDNSDDGSKEWLDIQAQNEEKLNVIHLIHDNRQLKGKRHALWQGIKASKHDYLLFTDADCKPCSNQWAQEMANHFSETKSIVIGYSPYERKKGLLNLLIQYDTWQTALQYLGFAAIKMPYMAVGRNVGYKKELLTKIIFDKSNKSTSGDDDLVFQQIATKQNTAISLTPSSFTTSKSATTFREWINQKTRHLDAGKHYNPKIAFNIGAYNFSHLIAYTSIGALLYAGTYSLALCCFITMLFLKLFLLNPLKTKLKLQYIRPHIFYLDFLYWLFYLAIAILSIFVKHEWKSPKNR